MVGRVRGSRVWHLVDVADHVVFSVWGKTRCNPGTDYRFERTAPGGEAQSNCRACLAASWRADPPLVLVS
jgi:hypothetical protein